MKGKQILLRSNHTRLGTDSRPRLRVAISAAIQHDDRWQRENQKRTSVRLRHEMERFAESSMKKYRAPKDGLVRAVAHDAAAARRRSDSIARFDRVVRVYAGLQLGYSNRYVVGEYVYVRINQLIEERRDALAKRVDGLVSRHFKEMPYLKMRLDEEIKPLHRQDLEHLAECVFCEIETHILSIAELGRPIKRKLPRDKEAVRGTIGMHRNFPCFVILERADDGVRVVAFKTARQFNRSVRRRMRPGGRQKYANVPTALRH